MTEPEPTDVCPKPKVKDIAGRILELITAAAFLLAIFLLADYKRMTCDPYWCRCVLVPGPEIPLQMAIGLNPHQPRFLNHSGRITGSNQKLRKKGQPLTALWGGIHRNAASINCSTSSPQTAIPALVVAKPQ